jgi:hypothetical protein
MVSATKQWFSTVTDETTLPWFCLETTIFHGFTAKPW